MDSDIEKAVLGELALRFVLGGGIVMTFSLVGEAFDPKTFSGLFGAAPSVALATLALTFALDGGGYASVEGRSMVLGALAFIAYGATCVATSRRHGIPVWLTATASRGVWFVVAFGLWGAGVAAGVLQ